MKTEIYCDSADLKTIRKLSNNSLVSGFTTNPSLMRLSGARNYKKSSLLNPGDAVYNPAATDPNAR